jgi:hypothetical protein
MKKKILYLLLALITIIAGLLSRKFADYLPNIVNLYLGDVMYALMMYWLIGMLFPKKSFGSKAFFAIVVCFCIEFSQMIEFEWLKFVRSTTLGRLILGRGFLISDLISYLVGASIGLVIEKTLYREK